MTDNAPSAVRWRDVLTREHAAKIATLAMAVWLHAANSMLTATTMPSAVEDIGGLHLINWTFSLYLAGSIVAGAATSVLVARSGMRRAMVRAAALYGIGCVVCALAPSMPVVLAGRVMQGLGGGGLVALVYISQDRFFPNRFVPKIVACLSMIWMLSSFIGPVIGGAFATWGVWRLAYWAFALQAVLLVFAIRILLPPSPGDPAAAQERIPHVRLVLLAASIVLVSMAGAHFDPIYSPALVLLGVLLLVLFVVRDRRATRSRMLPPNALDLNSIVGSGIWTTLLLCLSIMSFLVYGPLILIRLYDLTPFSAGMIVMLETLAWGTAAITFSGIAPRLEPWIIRTGSALVMSGLAAMALVLPHGPLWLVAVIVVIGNGGFGMMWGFIIRRIIGNAAPGEKDRSASLVPITQQTGFALGASLAGLVANGSGLDEQAGIDTLRNVTFWLFAAFVPLALAGNLAAWQFTRSGLPVENEKSHTTGI